MEIDVGNIWEVYSLEGLKIKETDDKFYNVKEEPFKIYGLYDPKNSYRRIPEDVLKKAPGITGHHANSTGVRVRFCTDSKYVGIRSKFKKTVLANPHVTRLAETGFDIYVEEDGRDVYFGSYYPPKDEFEGYEGVKHFNDNRMRQITIYFPIAMSMVHN